MALTLIEWIVLGAAALLGIGIAVYCFIYESNKYGFIVLSPQPPGGGVDEHPDPGSALLGNIQLVPKWHLL